MGEEPSSAAQRRNLFLRSFRDELERRRLEQVFYEGEWWRGVSEEVMSHVVTWESRLFDTAARGPDGEFVDALRPDTVQLFMPRFRLPAMMRRSPTSAVEAYRMALASLVGSDIERRRGETPREHARRVADSVIGRGLGRLAADYQISALARRRLTAAEERRALDRWRAISRESHANR